MIGNIPYTPRVKKVLVLASKEARALNHTYVGTEHILLGLLREGDHVITTAIEHNSVLRPLEHLMREGRITVTRVACDGQGFVDPDEVRRALRSSRCWAALV
jgi:cysteine sulfinate desulfinase/cysteine desulfurase-like protein